MLTSSDALNLRDPFLPDAEHWLVDGGEMGELIRSMDWSETPLGPLERWPHSLRTTVNLCLSSNFPINIVWGPGYNQIYNDGYRLIVGERHPEAMGMAYDVCWASAWPAIGGPFEHAWAGETSFLENVRMYLTRGGYLEETFFTFSLSPIRNERGVIAGLFHPVTETTASMLSERRTRALREFAVGASEARSLEAAFEVAGRNLLAHEYDLPFVLLYALSDDGRKARLVEATGIARGLPASPELISLDDPRGGWPLDEILQSANPIRIERLHERFGEFPCGCYPEGAHTAVAAAVQIAGVDAPLGVFIAGVSPRLPFTQAYRDFLDQLAAAVSSALANALAYEQERKRAEALAAIDRAKTQFFANVSHEFRTPLALMLGPLENALATGEEELSDSNRNQLRIARRNSLRLLKLVNTLLDFSRIEAGRTQASFEPTDLATWTTELAGNFRSAIESAGLDFEVDCPPLPAPVYVDRDMWEKIVLNLLSNALKFTLQGRIAVRLRAHGEAVQLQVEDTGSGIAPDQVARVFERFHRVEGALGRTHEGSGIGLALVDEFSRLHHGSATAESELGKGSIFSVTIPSGIAHLPAERIRPERQQAQTATRPEAYTEEAIRWSVSATQPEEHQQPEPPSDTVTHRILLAEDNADMRDYVIRVMGPGYTIEAVGDGEQALAAARARLPDLVLSDVMMPRMDGFELLRALRSDSRTQGLPVILLSARAGEEARVEGIEIGADDYLVKPFSPRELRARVRTQLDLQHLRRDVIQKESMLQTASVIRESEKLAVVGRLASSIAHEINNPLEAVTNLLYLASSDLAGSPAGEFVDLAQSELARITNITTQTLRFHRQATNATQVSLQEVLEGVLVLFRARFVNTDVKVERQYRTELRVEAFEADLRQVFANLIGNALDASARGARMVLRVHAAHEWSTGRNGLRLLVGDTGSGMSEATRQRIFEPFFTTKELHGTGLGLWVSSEILRNHKATVSVRSSQNPQHHGTVFSIFFPLAG